MARAGAVAGHEAFEKCTESIRHSRDLRPEGATVRNSASSEITDELLAMERPAHLARRRRLNLPQEKISGCRWRGAPRPSILQPFVQARRHPAAPARQEIIGRCSRPPASRTANASSTGSTSRSRRRRQSRPMLERPTRPTRSRRRAKRPTRFWSKDGVAGAEARGSDEPSTWSICALAEIGRASSRTTTRRHAGAQASS